MEFLNKPQKLGSKKDLILKIILAAMCIAILILFVWDYILYTQIKNFSQLSLGEIKTAPKKPQNTQPKILYNLQGRIQKIEEDSITIEAYTMEYDEKNKEIQKVEERKILIASTTAFSMMTLVSQAGTSTKTIQYVPITFKELEIGDLIEVISNKDISKAQEFEATQIRITPRGS